MSESSKSPNRKSSSSMTPPTIKVTEPCNDSGEPVEPPAEPSAAPPAEPSKEASPDDPPPVKYHALRRAKNESRSTTGIDLVMGMVGRR